MQNAHFFNACLNYSQKESKVNINKDNNQIKKNRQNQPKKEPPHAPTHCWVKCNIVEQIDNDSSLKLNQYKEPLLNLKKIT